MTATETPRKSLKDREAELKQKAAAVLREIEDLAAIENRSQGQNDRLDLLSASIPRIEGQIEEVRALREAEIRDYASKPDHIISGDGARVPDFQVMTRGGDPWADDVRGVSATELRDRALFAADKSERINDDMTGILEGLVNDDSHQSLSARWMVATSRPDYRAAFDKYLRNPAAIAMTLNDAERSAVAEVEQVRAAWAEGSTTTGGFAVVADYDLNLMVQNSGSISPIRQISRVVQTNSNVWKGLNTAGVSAAYGTESSEVSDDTPSVGQPSISVHRGHAYLQASFEAVQDSELGGSVAMLLADARTQLENDKFITGSGTNEPWGILPALRNAGSGVYVFGTSGSSTEESLKLDHLFLMDEQVPDRYRDKSAWVMARAIANKVRRLGENLTGQSAYWTDLGPGLPQQLLGHPVYTASAMSGTVTSGSADDIAVLGSFADGWIVADRIGTSITYQPLVTGASFRPIGAVGWYCFFRNGAGLQDSTADQFRLLRV